MGDGEGLASSFIEDFEASGGTIEAVLAYSVHVESFDAELDEYVFVN